jgi:hypothetical protein
MSSSFLDEGQTSNFEGQTSNFEGQTSNFEGQRLSFESQRFNLEGPPEFLVPPPPIPPIALTDLAFIEECQKNVKIKISFTLYI